jgi:hypothetical protein
MPHSHLLPRSDRTGRTGAPAPARWLAALLLGLAVFSLTASTAPAQTKVSGATQPAASTSTVATSFQAAARHWNVPLELLMAVGYVESHWEQRDGAPSIDMGYGIMHLVDGPGGTLERAASLTGLSGEAIRKHATANIEAGAALLSDISHKNNIPAKQTKLTDWYGVVAAYSGAPDLTVRDAYARQVFQVIQEGAQVTLTSGEVVTLPATDVGVLPKPLAPAPGSEDYGPALWVAAHPNNYRVGRPYGPLNQIIIHDTEGSYNSAINWFQNPNSGVSAHYVIRSSDGQITQMVREANTGYHAGNWDYNVRTVGIEHEGYMNQQGWYTEAMYQSSAALARNIADKYGMKKDRAHVIAHSEVPNQSHTDPGPYWNWTYYMGLVRRDSAMSALVDNTDAGFVPVPSDITPQNYWYVHGGGYGSSNTYVTTSVSNSQNSVNSATWTATLDTTGYYDVYAFVPWVDNNTPDSASARYQVYAANGTVSATTSQKAITDRGTGSWAHLGKFYFNGGADATVYLNDYTGETGKNVWFDSVMWIPSEAGGAPPTPVPATPTRTPQPTSTRTPTYTPTALPTETFTPVATWTPGPCGMRFNDLPDTHWAYGYMADLFCRGTISGYDDGTIRPNESSTRGQFTKMLVLGFGWTIYNPYFPTYSDVEPGSTFYQYIETASLRGVIGGYSDGTFHPNAPLTRAQAAKILMLAGELSAPMPAQPSYSDVAADDWAYTYVETARSIGIMGGYDDGTFRPGLPVTRAQLAKMLLLTLQQP